jgi:MSHA biogenesis protein MshO
MNRYSTRIRGFTLIEMILVIVLLGILSGLLAPVITQNIRAYSDSKARNEMMARGRIALGRLERELRLAIPYSIVVTGSTLKFVTAISGGRYLQRAESPPKIANTDCSQNNERFYTSTSADKLTGLCLLSPTPLPVPATNSALALVIGNQSSASLYSYSDPGSWIGLSSTTAPVQLGDVDYQGVVWKVTFVTAHSFNNASSFKNYQIADFTHQLTHSGDTLQWRRSDGISDPTPGTAATLITGVSTIVYDTSNLANGLLNISLTLTESGETITMSEDIYVRNTP